MQWQPELTSSLLMPFIMYMFAQITIYALIYISICSNDLLLSSIVERTVHCNA